MKIDSSFIHVYFQGIPLDVAAPDACVNEIDLEVDETQFFLVYVTYVESPGGFWIQIAKTEDMLERLMSDMK